MRNEYFYQDVVVLVVLEHLSFLSAPKKPHKSAKKQLQGSKERGMLIGRSKRERQEIFENRTGQAQKKRQFKEED